MRLFSKLYDRVISWAGHRHAPWYLGGLSFAESSFFPIPPDVMLAPMALAAPKKAWYYAILTTAASVAGGVAGYIIGLFAFELITPTLQASGYWDDYMRIKEWFGEWGAWVVFTAGFSPIPYKIFTIGAGAVSLSFLPFLLASTVGRGARFLLVAGLIVAGGAKMERVLRKNVDMIGWAVVVLIVIYFIYRIT